MQQAIGSAHTRHLVVDLHVIGLYAGVPHQEGHGFLHVGTHFHGRGVVGHDGHADRFVPCLHLIIDGFHDAVVEILDGAQFEVEVTVMACLIAGLQVALINHQKILQYLHYLNFLYKQYDLIYLKEKK